jgi:hypothetical protein
MHSGQTAKPEEFWTAIKKSGFTPLKIEMGQEVYEGP